jgi:hypothetical protein
MGAIPRRGIPRRGIPRSAIPRRAIPRPACVRIALVRTLVRIQQLGPIQPDPPGSGGAGSFDTGSDAVRRRR